MVEEITLPPTGHQYQDGICTVCGEIDPDYVKPHEHSMTAVQEKNQHVQKPEIKHTTGVRLAENYIWIKMERTKQHWRR